MSKNKISDNMTSMASDTKSPLIFEISNSVARDILGAGNENIKVLEKALNVDIRLHNNGLSIQGEGKAKKQALGVLETLSKMKDITPAAVKGVLATSSSKVMKDKGGAQIATRAKTLFARTPTQNEYMHAMTNHELVFGVGPAGTGKTYLAVAHAAALLESGKVDRIIMSRPAVEAGERLGFLPGDMKEKVDPYLRPLYDALYDMMKAENVEKALTTGIIEVAPLAFMRGRTLTNAAVILDEAQNTTSMQMKMFLTRLGEGSRMIVTGDPSQIDLPRGEKSGLIEAINLLKDVEGVAITHFLEKDVVRHELVGRIVKAYNAHDKAEAARKADLAPNVSRQPALTPNN